MKRYTLIILISLLSLSRMMAQCDAIPYFSYWNNSNELQFFPHVDSPYLIMESTWSFSDGVVMQSTGTAPIYRSFPVIGDYEVCVTYTLVNPDDEGNTCVVTNCQTITVTCVYLQMSLSYELLTDSTFTVTADVLDGNEPITYSWSSWPGLIIETSGNVATVSFDGRSYSGVYCFAFESGGNQSCGSQQVHILVDNPTVECNLQLTATVQENVVTVDGVLFDGEYESTYPFVNFDFGDGPIGNAAGDLHVTHAYPTTGTYEICGISQAEFEDSCLDTTCFFVEIESIDQDCQAAFDFQVSTGNYISLTNASTGYYTDLLWSVDGVESDQSTFWGEVQSWPVSVSLVITNDSTGCTSTVTESITLQDQVYHVCGTMYWDANNDHVMNNSEAGLPYENITLTDSNLNMIVVQTAMDGSYCVDLPLGTSYTLTPHLASNASAPFSPANYSAQGYWSNSTSYINFGTYFTLGIPDVEVNCNGSHFISQNSGNWFIVNLANNSDVIASGELTIHSGADEHFNGLPSIPGVLSESNSVFTATLNLQPFEQMVLYFFVLVDPTTAIGTIEELSASFIVSNGIDANESDNSCFTSQLVLGSYDPNNKEVVPAGSGEEGRILPTTQWLSYTINFQNTGTAPAFNVRVEDEISQYLDITSFEVVASSHPCYSVIEGDQVDFHFDNIMLPDSAENEQASHGFVTYRLKVQEGLQDGTVINNTAEIYFDLNEAVITNTTVNTIDYLINNVQDNEKNQLMVYPNPAEDVVYLQTNLPATVGIYDAMGSLIELKRINAGVNQLNISTYAKGVYTLQLFSNDSNETYRIMKK